MICFKMFPFAFLLFDELMYYYKCFINWFFERFSVIYSNIFILHITYMWWLKIPLGVIYNLVGQKLKKICIYMYISTWYKHPIVLFKNYIQLRVRACNVWAYAWNLRRHLSERDLHRATPGETQDLGFCVSSKLWPQ